MFQSYALFPHLTVAENIAFGLRFAKFDKAEVARKVADALELVRLKGFDARKPHQLSGGQQQRVALARALVLRPKVLLLDEPLGALDAKLRKTLQLELVSLQRDVGITFVYVTHDQEEALTMSDRLAVMDRGVVAQVGAPRDVYEQPSTAYVADFLGVANLLDAEANGDGSCTIAGQRIGVPDSATMSGAARLVVRPERLRIARTAPRSTSRDASATSSTSARSTTSTSISARACRCRRSSPTTATRRCRERGGSRAPVVPAGSRTRAERLAGASDAHHEASSFSVLSPALSTPWRRCMMRMIANTAISASVEASSMIVASALSAGVAPPRTEP